MSMPGEDDVSKALKYLAETDVPYAKVMAHVKAMEYQLKTIKGLSFLEAKGTVADRTAESESCLTYRTWVNDYENSYADMKIMDSRRKRAELTIDVWRSINANRRQG